MGRNSGFLGPGFVQEIERKRQRDRAKKRAAFEAAQAKFEQEKLEKELADKEIAEQRTKDVRKKKAKQKEEGRGARGRQSTILTSPTGLIGEPATEPKKLTGR